MSKKEVFQLLLLTGLAFALRLYMAQLDPFLHLWDERFHALVARNMMSDPLVPVLRRGQFLPYDYDAWCCNVVWLHKQPLSLWQMAVSMKIFGVSEFSLRLPSVVMGTLTVPLTYSIARHLGLSHYGRVLAAALMAFCYFQLEMVSGFTGMDHVDMAFGFYVLLSIWAWVKYYRSGRWGWVAMIGAAAGCAVLCKWLTGLLVYSGWGLAILPWLFKEKSRFFRELPRMAVALAITTAVALPWQLYILHRFPLEAGHEFRFNAKHFSEAVEGHYGNWSFYLLRLPEYFGPFAFLLVPVGLALGAVSKTIDRRLWLGLGGMLLLLFTFFSIAATKISPYVMPVVPIGCLAVAIVVEMALPLLRQHKKRIAGSTISILMIVFILQPWRIAHNHDAGNSDRQATIYNTAIYKKLPDHLPADVHLLLNAANFEDVSIMFYNPGVLVHSWSLTPETFQVVEKNGWKVAAFPDHGEYGLPPYVKTYPKTMVLPFLLK